jgi:mRNA-decapping enzyme subunit 2
MTSMNKAPENLDDALIDVETRFLYSFPENELNKADRLFFQIEQAYWYYEDFKADRYSHLPHYSNLKSFAKLIFEHCELLKSKTDSFQELFESFANYKSKIPVCGCILLNPSMTKLVLVCNWDGKSWSFPRGKIDENESEYHCAMREVYEETGFNPESYCNESEYLISFQEQKKIQLFIGVNVPEDTVFQCKTRKEISKIEFFDINNLPKNTYCVHPFIPKLKRWIDKKQKILNKLASKSPYLNALNASTSKGKKDQGTPNRKIKLGDKENSRENAIPKILKRRNNSSAIDSKNVDTFSLFPSIAEGKEENSGEGWSVEEMFKANSKITGKAYDYDGNPHSFGSSHPKFVNYRDYTDVKKSASLFSSDPSDMDFQNLSLQSQTLGEKLLRGDGKESDGIEYFALPVSTLNKEKHSGGKSRSFFTVPFRFDTKDIMSGIDSVLVNFTFE